jgi:hypothetical protein
MFTELFRIGCRANLIAAGILALVPLSGALAAQSATAPAPSKIAAHAKAKISGKAGTADKAKAAAGPKRKTAKPAPPPALVPSPTASRVQAWIAASHDNGSLPYIVIDKQAAALFLFDADGQLLGQTPVLLGMGVGDDSTPGVGAKTLAEIGPAERTTPAGRFVAKFGRALGHTSVLWVDYADSVALHAVITTNKKEHRVARLLSPTPDDNRISFGCINVGTSFYAKRISPLFRKAGGVVYILPDTKPLEDVFPSIRLLPYLNGDGSQ